MLAEYEGLCLEKWDGKPPTKNCTNAYCGLASCNSKNTMFGSTDTQNPTAGVAINELEKYSLFWGRSSCSFQGETLCKEDNIE